MKVLFLCENFEQNSLREDIFKKPVRTGNKTEENTQKNTTNLSRLEDLKKNIFMLVFNFEVLFHCDLKTVHFSTFQNVIDLATLMGKA